MKQTLYRLAAVALTSGLMVACSHQPDVDTNAPVTGTSGTTNSTTSSTTNTDPGTATTGNNPGTNYNSGMSGSGTKAQPSPSPTARGTAPMNQPSSGGY